jgi:hypothetical protein
LRIEKWGATKMVPVCPVQLLYFVECFSSGLQLQALPFDSICVPFFVVVCFALVAYLPCWKWGGSETGFVDQLDISGLEMVLG